jgi:hypothetical protein
MPENGPFATDPAGLACHLVSALAGERPDCNRTRMADISAPPRFMRETQCCPKCALERSRLTARTIGPHPAVAIPRALSASAISLRVRAPVSGLRG